MNVIECVARLGRRKGRRRRETPVMPLKLAGAGGHDVWTVHAVAAVSLSGMMGDITDDAGIDEALLHFGACFSAGVFDCEKWNDEAKAVGNALVDYAARMEDPEERVAHNVHPLQLMPQAKGGRRA